MTDPELLAASPSEPALAEVRAGRTCLERLEIACRVYADRPALHDPTSGPLSFARLWQRVTALAAGLRADGAAPGERVGILGPPSVEWILADLACLVLGAVSVPLHAGSSVDERRHIAAQTGMTRLFGDAAGLPLRRLDGAELEARGAGRELPRRADADPEALRTLIYTSGSTGRPRGAMFPERVWLEYWRDPFELLPRVPGVRLAHLPLDHVAGRRQLLFSLLGGGVTHLPSSSDPAGLFAEIRRVRPTMLFLVPAVSAAIHQHHLRRELDPGFLGDRLRYLMTGSAPTAPAVHAFLADFFGVPVLRGYAATEAGMLSLNEQVARNVQSFRVVDDPELGYRTSDRPHPRGELRVKTRAMIPGYFEDPEATAALFDDAGYLRTGDLVEQRGPTEIVWIDRRPDVVKLARGELVAVARVEAILAAGSPLIQQIFVHGDGHHADLVAIVVPREAAAAARAIEDDLRCVAAAAGLRPGEVPRAIALEPEPFSVGNGLLTDAGKLARARLRARYRERLDALHAALEAAPAPATDATIGGTVRALLLPLLDAGDREREIGDDVALGAGGLALDSLRLLEAVLACEARFGIALPLADLRPETGAEPTVGRLVELIAAKAVR